MFFGGVPFGMPGMDDGGGGMPGQRQARGPVDTTMLYKQLEIEKTATQTEVKKAFRKLALKKHPDKGGDPDEFKKISAAYEILSDPEKRAIYDKHGLEGVEGGGGGGGGEGPGDIFDMFFGGGGGGRRGGGGGRGGPRKGEDLVHPLKVSLEDLYKGKTARLAITRNKIIGEPRSCDACNGRGVVVQMRQIGPGMVQQLQARCSECSGGGFKVKKERERKVLEVNIEKGAMHSQKIRFPGAADEQPQTEPGDVVFVIQEKEHAKFKRKGADLLLFKNISLVEALTGFEFPVKHLDDRILLIKSKPGEVIRPESKDGQPYVKCIYNEGMPKAGNPFDKGRLFILFKIVFPTDGQLSAGACQQLKAALPKGIANDGSLDFDADDVEEAFLDDVDLKDFGHGVGAATSGGADESDDERQGGPGGPGVQCQQS